MESMKDSVMAMINDLAAQVGDSGTGETGKRRHRLPALREYRLGGNYKR